VATRKRGSVQGFVEGRGKLHTLDQVSAPVGPGAADQATWMTPCLTANDTASSFDTAGGTAYVAMELLVGESLRQALDKRPLPVARAVQILDDVASALAYAHEEGVVHRGIKPSNIIILRSTMSEMPMRLKTPR